MKKNDCNVIRDLMPLVLDRVASDESRGLVEEHMETCEECRTEYEKMKADMPQETLAEYEEEQRTIVEALKKAKRQKRMRLFRRIVLPVVLSIAVLIGGLMLYGYLFVWPSVPVENDLYTLSLAQLKDGTIDVTVEEYALIAYARSTVCSERTENGKHIMYLYFNTAPIHGKAEKNIRAKFSYMSFGPGTDDIDEIRQGGPNDYKTIWKKGDTIPAASEEMEAFYAFEKEQSEKDYQGWNLPEDQEEMDAHEKKWQELQAAVPEWH